MTPPTRVHFTLFEACARWEKTLPEVMGWAAKGLLRLETGIPFANSPSGPVAGTVELNAADLMRMARIDGRAPRSMRVHRVRIPDDPDRPDWIFVSDEEGRPGIEIQVDDIFIPAEEYRRFERKAELGPPRQASPNRRTPPPAQSRYDWEGMFVALCKRVFESGLPETQETLVLEMEEHFRNKGDTPDISTIRKKVSPLWAELRGAG